MSNYERGTSETKSVNSVDIRDERRPGKLPCGATHCYRCQEACGVIANAWILRDLAEENNGVASAQRD